MRFISSTERSFIPRISFFSNFIRGLEKFNCETQILQTQYSNICKLNYPAVGGGYQRYPWYPRSAA
jgi:hypothetical protein